MKMVTVTPSKMAIRLAKEVRYVGEHCAECGHVYADVDDFLERDPKQGLGDDIVCDMCWEEYLKKRT